MCTGEHVRSMLRRSSFCLEGSHGQWRGANRTVEAITLASAIFNEGSIHISRLEPATYLPVAFTFDHAPRYLKETIGTVPADDFFYRTSRTTNLMTVFTVKEMFQWV